MSSPPTSSGRRATAARSDTAGLRAAPASPDASRLARRLALRGAWPARGGQGERRGVARRGRRAVEHGHGARVQPRGGGCAPRGGGRLTPLRRLSSVLVGARAVHGARRGPAAGRPLLLRGEDDRARRAPAARPRPSGELIGMGTVPNCCGLEIGRRPAAHEVKEEASSFARAFPEPFRRWLQPGDEVALSAEGLGTLTNTVGHPPATAQNFKEVDCGGGAPPGRLRTALRCALLAVVLPPLTFALMVGGALSALLWRGPAGVLRSPAPTVPAIRRAADKRR